MEGAVRHLRDGRLKDDEPAPLLLLQDSLSTIGGPHIFQKLLLDLFTAIAQGRSQARSVKLLAVERPPAAYASLAAVLSAARCHIVNAYSDPYGWASEIDSSAEDGNQGKTAAAAAPAAAAAACDLQALEAMLIQDRDDSISQPHAALHPSPASACIVVDGLSALLRRQPPLRVARALQRLQASPSVSCIVAALHTDLHAPEVFAALRQGASSLLTLHPVAGLQCSAARARLGKIPHGTVEYSYRRRAGRVRVENQAYSLLPGGGVEFYALPDEARLSAHELIASALPGIAALGLGSAPSVPFASALGDGQGARGTLAAAGAGGTERPPPAHAPAPVQAPVPAAGGMRFELTEAEKAARQRVVLPYEHRGEGSAYQTGDYLDYLPAAAGGRGAGVGAARAGHILYVRDSSEEADSDEDPDDDLDI